MRTAVGGPPAVTRLGYQDDTYLAGAASAAAAGYPALEAALARVGHRMRASKCSVWAPAMDRVEDESELPEKLRGLCRLFPRVKGGIKLLGGAVDGALEVDVTLGAFGIQPTLKRADRAAALAGRVREFVIAQPVPPIGADRMVVGFQVH